MRLEKEEKPQKYLVCHTRMKSSKYYCPLEESAGEKKNGDKKHRDEVREKVGGGKLSVLMTCFLVIKKLVAAQCAGVHGCVTEESGVEGENAVFANWKTVHSIFINKRSSEQGCSANIYLA